MASFFVWHSCSRHMVIFEFIVINFNSYSVKKIANLIYRRTFLPLTFWFFMMFHNISLSCFVFLFPNGLYNYVGSFVKWVVLRGQSDYLLRVGSWFFRLYFVKICSYMFMIFKSRRQPLNGYYLGFLLFKNCFTFWSRLSLQISTIFTLDFWLTLLTVSTEWILISFTYWIT